MSTKTPADLPYRPCVGIVLLNRDGLVWIGRRVPKWKGDGSEQLWQMPQGGIDKGETPLEAARRELREETGIAQATILAETDGWLTYDLPAEAIGKGLKGRFRGQKQKWFAMRFEGDDSEIDITDTDGDELEFDAWRWERFDRVTDLVVPFKRDVYRQVVAAFAHLIADTPAGTET